MKAEYVNPFLNATKNVIETMASTSVTAGKPEIKHGNKTWGVVTGVIGLTCDQLKGNMVVSFDAASILGIVSRMLGEEFKEVNKDVIDAVGELTNMITGGAKKEFAEKGYKFEMAIPVMVSGQNVEIVQFGKGPVIVITFKTEQVAFVIEASLGEK